MNNQSSGVADPLVPDIAAPLVSTVRGPVPASALGAVLPHEHLLGTFTEDAQDQAFYEAPLEMSMLGRIALGWTNADNSRLADEALAIAELCPPEPTAPPSQAAVLAGGTAGEQAEPAPLPAVVDLTGIDQGRRPAALRRIGAATGRHVVMGTGWYQAPESRSAEDLAAQLVAELGTGVSVKDGEPVRAGVIGALKALDPAVSAEAALLQAAALAAKETGAPIAIEAAATVEQTARLLDALAEHGADLARVAVLGCDPFSPSPAQLETLLRQRVSVVFDHLGRLPTARSSYADADVAAAILHLAGQGFADRLLVSQGVRSKSQLLAYGGGGYRFVTDQFLPYLGFMFGAEPALIQALTVTAPARWLAGTKGASA